MHTFEYARPATLAEAVGLLAEHGPGARVLAGGTDLLIRLRDGSATATVVVDVKRIPEMRPSIERVDGHLRIGANTAMTDLMADPQLRTLFPALIDAASVVGSVQIRNRATLAGNLCNASPAADTAPPLLVYGAILETAGPDGVRRVPLDELFVRSGLTTLLLGELVTAIVLPLPAGSTGSAHVRRTRRRGHDLASVTLACLIDASGASWIAYGSVGPRPIVVSDPDRILADRAADPAARTAVLERLLADASPSPRSMRASPEYRLAMLRVLGARAVQTALDRRDGRN